MIPRGLILPAATMGALLASSQAQATGTLNLSGISFNNSGFGFASSSKGKSTSLKDVFHVLGGSNSSSFGGSFFGISFGKDHGKGSVFNPKDFGFKDAKDWLKWLEKNPIKGGIHFGKDWFKWIGKNHGHHGHGHNHNGDCEEPGGETGNPGTPPVPEPATWAFMIVGFGLIGAAMRRGYPAARSTIQYS